MKRTVEATHEDVLPKLPEVEKLNRLDAFVFQYPGVNITGAGEPSSALIDEFVQMVKHGQREDEVLAKKRAQIKSVPIKWTGDCAGITASADSLPEVTTELESDYLVRKALHRRSVAAHVAGWRTSR
eukprot:1294308-Amphidinium_carterae.1